MLPPAVVIDFKLVYHLKAYIELVRIFHPVIVSLSVDDSVESAHAWLDNAGIEVDAVDAVADDSNRFESIVLSVSSDLHLTSDLLASGINAIHIPIP